MSTCSRCGAGFACGMVDGSSGPCWCTRLPPAVPLPESSQASAGASEQANIDTPGAGCWCPACLEAHIAQLARTREA
ncbi:cysteine-rich CWC family protein [Massilia sp. 9096]|uniref:cysteine-rich CWC family protein n=1 Tax=Massilia sp. 9096 TaxID=1500894 RepID=UPI0005677C5F|nr:cysteine-rich CWC family protein [Massilia sp. 9096]